MLQVAIDIEQDWSARRPDLEIITQVVGDEVRVYELRTMALPRFLVAYRLNRCEVPGCNQIVKGSSFRDRRVCYQHWCNTTGES
jgi:hypothetical protein